MLNGLSHINIELTNHCSKHTLCAMCGHQDPKIFPNIKFGFMDFQLLCKIRDQIPPGIVIQFHRDGDPVDYPRLGGALKLFPNNITSIVTHGEKLAEKSHEVIGNCTTLTVSVIRNDPDREIQLNALKTFLALKEEKKPMVNLKFVGNVEYPEDYEELGLPILGRALHPKDGNYRYIRSTPPIPEHGICLDFLNKPTIDCWGNVYICNRLDTENKGLLGNLDKFTLEEIWTSDHRMKWLKYHTEHRRDMVPACQNCTYYGIPASHS